MDALIFSDNPMTNGCKCLVCALCDKDTEINNLEEITKIFKPGAVIAVEDEKNLPVYPDLDAIIHDTIEATFNPDIDKTCHFDLGDIDNLYIFEATLLGDATSTAIKCVYTAKACLIERGYDMVPIRTEIRLKAAKYGKALIDGQKSARTLQKEQEGTNIDNTNYQEIMNKFDLSNIVNKGFDKIREKYGDIEITMDDEEENIINNTDINNTDINNISNDEQ